MTPVLRVDDATLAAFAVRSGAGRTSRAALGGELDAAADVLLLGDLDDVSESSVSPDRTAAAAALLAITRRVVVVPIIAARQHPVNLARVAATLSNLHGRRVGLAGRSAEELSLISQLWESWPLDTIVGDAEAGVYVDYSRIVRISDPVHPSIGGPLTLPVDVFDKPVTVLLASSGVVGTGVDVVLDATAVPVWGADVASAEVSHAGGARAVFGLGPSAPFATGIPAFSGAGRLDQV
jgi:alkanesulfonate monooxygenase SsuD/methylene tetrahydromethanopterin reductase-like flavin-dependent oxidoreductase (luciferase family)